MNDTGNIRVIERDGRTIWLVGTAHVSHESVAEVQRVIDEVDPDTVWFALDTAVGRDVTIGPNVWFGPEVTVESGATIHGF